MKKLLLSFFAICQFSFVAYSQVTFSVNTNSGCAPLNVNFTTTSTSGNYYEWEYFGNFPKEYVKNPSHTFYNPGMYNVQLSVYDTTGGAMIYIGSMTQMINVMGSGLYTNADYVCPNEELDIYVMPYGSNYNWNFGDGNTSTESNPNHAYSSPGTYTISVSVNTSCGSQNLTHTISVQPNTIPTSEFFFKDPTCPNEQIGFDADNYKLASYSWDFGDGGTATGDNRPSHTYTATGNYLAVLSVTSTCGTSSSTTKTVHIQSGLMVEPTTNINLSNSLVCPNDPIQFGFYPEGGNAYVWNFGNGATSNEQQPVYTYTNTGVYTVSLTITNGCGNSATFTKTLEVSSGIPYNGGTDVSINPNVACPNSNVYFNAPSATSISWNFGDGNSSTIQNPVHSYSTANTYTVSVMLTNGCGNGTTITNTVLIDPNVVPSINQNMWGTPGTDACPGDTVIFYAFGGASYLWDFGDGNTTTQTFSLAINDGNNGNMIIDIVKHAYSALGTYKVKLKYFNTCGNSAVDSLNMNIGSGNPVNGGIAPTTTSFNTCEPATFIAIGGTSYQWNFGDGNTLSTNQTQVSHSYSVAGNYTVSVIITNGCGNTDTPSETITVQSCTTTAVKENSVLENGLIVYPNPFDNAATLELKLNNAAFTSIEMFNINGEKVSTFSKSDLSKGSHIINIDGSNLSNGIYFIKVSTSAETKTLKVVIMK